MGDIYAIVRQHWVDRGIEPNGGASETEIEAFEHRYGVRLPGDLREYFARLNGVVGGREGECDENLVVFWRLSDVLPLSEEAPEINVPEADRYFVFADYSIWCHAYLVRLSQVPSASGPVFLSWSPTPPRVADTFGEFLEGCLRGDSWVLYGVRKPRHAL